MYDKNMPTFEYDKYDIIQKIGEGSFGTVYLVKDRLTSREYALKQIIIHGNNKYSISNFKIFFEILSSLNHENIVKIYDTKLINNSLNILMERGIMDWYSEIELRSQRNYKKYYTELEIFIILKQLVSGFSFLQENKIAHRDIKPNNILIFPNGIYKIADLDEGIIMDNNKNQNQAIRGSELFMSPVLFNRLKGQNDTANYNPFKSDVFSLGYCFLYAMSLNIDVLKKIRKLKYVDNIKEKLINYFCDELKYSKRLINIICDMIEYEEYRRCDFKQLDEKLKKIMVK